MENTIDDIQKNAPKTIVIKHAPSESWYLFSDKYPVRYGKYSKLKWYTRETKIDSETGLCAEFQKFYSAYHGSTKQFSICFGMSMSNSCLMAFDVDGHTEAEQATLESRKDAVVAVLREIKVSPAIEKSGRGYHIWGVFDRCISEAQRNYIYTLVEAAVPNIEGRLFETTYCIRLPGLYKDSGTFGIDAETNDSLETFQAVHAFFSRHAVSADDVIWTKDIEVVSTPQKRSTKMKKVNNVNPATEDTKKEDAARDAFINGSESNTGTSEIVTKVIDLEASNFEAFAQKSGFIVNSDGFMPEKVNCVMREVIGLLCKIKDTPKLGLAIEDFQGSEVNGYLRKSGNQISLFCARDPQRPLAQIVVVGTQKRAKKPRASHQESLSPAYL